MELFKLVGSIFVDNEKANQSIAKTDKQATGLGTKFAKGIGTAAKWGAAIATGAAVGAAALVKTATSAAETTDKIDKMSQKIGISREAYQELDFICSQSGTSVDSLQGGLKKLTAQMTSASQGGKTASAAFEKLGLSITDSNGQLKSQEDMMFEAMSALQGVENQTEKAALATQLFGRSGSELMPLLNGTSGSIEEMKQQAHDLGLVLSDESVDAGVKLTDTMDQTKRAFSSIVTQVGVKVMPVIQKALEFVLANLPKVKDVVNNVYQKIKPIIESVKLVIASLVDYVKGKAPELKKTAQNIVESCVKFWNEHLKPMFEAIISFIQDKVVPVVKFLYENVFKPYLAATLKQVKDFWNNGLKPFLTGIVDFIAGVFSGDWKKAFEGLANIIKGVFGTIEAAIKKPLNFAIGMFNKFINRINGIKIPTALQKIVGMTNLNIPEVPLLAKGGTLSTSGSVIVGDAGPEMLDLPVGAKVTPLQNKNVSVGSEDTDKILIAISKKLDVLASVIPEGMADAVEGMSVQVSERQFGRVVRKYATS